ncbi:MAG: cytochrome P450 [Planctomycetota bacterium]
MSHMKFRSTGNRFLTTWKFMRDPFTCYRRWKQDFGESFMVRALNGNVVATCNRENIRRVFAARSGEVGQFAVGTIAPLMGGSSLFIVEGEQHRRERAMLSPSFRGERINNKAEEIREVAMRVARGWQPGQTMRMMDPSLDVSLEVIIRVVFGVQSPELVEEFKARIKKFVSSFHPSLAFSRLLQRPLLGLSPWNRFLKARSELFELLDEQIKLRRQSEIDSDNMLSGLMHARYEDGTGVSDKGIRDQLVTMLLAGHETTQIAISWAMSWLHRHPEFAERLRAELDKDDSIDAILRSPLLDGICNESLRINSIVSDIVRTVREPMEWEEGTLAAGTNIAVAICLVHEDPELYPDPMAFNPDRWSGAKLKPHEFMPFGGGIRRCLGAPLAILEMKIVIAAWMQNCRFELPPDRPEHEPVYRRNVTMAPKSGIPLTYTGQRN